MKNLFFFLLLFFSISLLGQKTDCQKYRNGKFKVFDAKNGDLIIIRKRGKQLEIVEKMKIKLLFKVTWIDNCTYTLELKKILENGYKMELPKNMIVTVHINEVRDKSYLQTLTSNLSKIEIEAEAFRID